MKPAKYRNCLPQRSGQTLLTDSGLETTLVFVEGLELPCFAAFTLLETADGTARLRAYYRKHAEIAREQRLGFVLDTPTWRASADWGALLGYDAAELDAANRAAVEMLLDLRDDLETPWTLMVVSGNIGPRGDGYSPAFLMSAGEAEAYHAAQVGTFASAGVDMITVMTMTYAEEAIGLAWAATKAGVPIVISFTVETDGNLPSGQSLGAAISQVDRETGSAPVYYMINCAHPDHFREAVATGHGWVERIGGVRANASRLSHVELDAAEVLDDGDPEELGRDHAALARLLPGLRVFGGCCGTDHRHVEAIARSCCALAA